VSTPFHSGFNGEFDPLAAQGPECPLMEGAGLKPSRHHDGIPEHVCSALILASLPIENPQKIAAV
jgi:hypothetical protein